MDNLEASVNSIERTDMFKTNRKNSKKFSRALLFKLKKLEDNIFSVANAKTI